MKPNLIARWASFFVGFAIAWGAQGWTKEKGGGMGNGGIAMKCPGKSLEMLDTAMPERAEDVGRYAIPETRVELVARVRERLADNENLLKHVLRSYAEFSSSEYWEKADSKRTFDAFLPRPLPKGCKLVQVAYFQDGKPLVRAENHARLSEAQRRVLELHEAVFAVGVRAYSHTSPVLSRMLVGEILARESDAERMKIVTAKFSLFGGLSRNFDLLTATVVVTTGLIRHDNLVGIFRLDDAPDAPRDFLGARGCPEHLVAETTMSQGSQVAFADGLASDSAEFRGFSHRLNLGRQHDSSAGFLDGKARLNYAAQEDRLELLWKGELACRYVRDLSMSNQESPNCLIRLSDHGLMKK